MMGQLPPKRVTPDMVFEHVGLDFAGRFVARRGNPSSIWSDHGTNFVGANCILKELYRGNDTLYLYTFVFLLL